MPSDHPLRPIRQMVNAALVKMDALFSGMYEADIKGGRPSIAPEKLLLRSERQLMEQGERVSVDGTLIQAWGHKSFVRKDGADDDSDARVYCKADNANRLRYMGRTLTDNRRGLVANAMVTTADGVSEPEAAKTMIDDARQAAGNPQTEITLGADKGYTPRTSSTLP